jgi:hypothetical protein
MYEAFEKAAFAFRQEKEMKSFQVVEQYLDAR